MLLGLCSLLPGPQTRVLPAPVLKRLQKHTLVSARSHLFPQQSDYKKWFCDEGHLCILCQTQTPPGSHCRQRQAEHGEYQLPEEDSWLRYTLPQKELNHR